MRRVALHFPRWAKGVLYGNLLLSLSTGVTWFSLHQWFQIEGEFGPEKHPLEPLLIEVHGASAFAFMIAFGYLLASHVPVAHRAKRNRPLGYTLVAIISTLIITGYGLYYAGSEALRSGISLLHLAVGLSFPLVLALHIWRGHRRKAAPPHSSN
jgi:hypothetical protein